MGNTKLYTEEQVILIALQVKNSGYWDGFNIIPIELPSDEEIESKYYEELEQRREIAKNFKGQVAGRHPDMFGGSEVHHMVRGYLEAIKYIKNFNLQKNITSEKVNNLIPENLPLIGMKLEELIYFRKAIKNNFVKITCGDDVIIDYSSHFDLWNKLILYIHNDPTSDFIKNLNLPIRFEIDSCYKEGTYGNMALAVVDGYISFLTKK